VEYGKLAADLGQRSVSLLMPDFKVEPEVLYLAE
jgi:hypothetical protein